MISLKVPLKPAQIAAATRLHVELPSWKTTDAALDLLAVQLPGFDKESCLLKAAAINQLYGTNVYALSRVARHVFDVMKEPALDLVERLALVANGPKPRRHLSFASKFAHFYVNKDAYAIFDSYAVRALRHHLDFAAWLNEQGFRKRKGRRFTGHAVKDMLRCRLYIGLVHCGEEEFEGKHEAIVDRELFDAVQRLRRPRARARLVHGARGVLQGRAGCIRCGNPLHSDRQHRTGLPMYRERHAFDCETNNHACMAGPVDEQMGALFGSLSIPPDWPERIATLAAKRSCRRVNVASLRLVTAHEAPSIPFQEQEDPERLPIAV
ncbi:MAG: hypothetical protein EPO22_12095 [Dehalococcoidia bacterium]|nr:MAG: hypothetical protein EPO22_12095 [Dehalococcoidia bacterium]